MLVGGMNIVHISRLLGHTDVRTIQYYLEVTLKNLQLEIRLKHPREKIEEKLNSKGERP